MVKLTALVVTKPSSQRFNFKLATSKLVLCRQAAAYPRLAGRCTLRRTRLRGGVFNCFFKSIDACSKFCEKCGPRRKSSTTVAKLMGEISCKIQTMSKGEGTRSGKANDYVDAMVL
jgi:hypothetical protein